MDNFPMDDWGVSVLLGCKLKGAKYKIYDDIDLVPRNRETMVVGWVEDTIKFFQDMNYNVPLDLTIPNVLHKEKFLKRNVIMVNTFDELKRITKPFFIKPQFVKAFDHGLILNTHDLLKYKDNSNFIISDIVDFVTEYRCYIIDKKIVGCYNYLGDFRIYPNLNLVDDMINSFVNQPLGYSIDVGVLHNGETCLIEVNDGWSLGNYGLEPKLYTRLLTERWVQILKNNQ
jgi:hypothetical protein